jgi:hypothetical protein
LSSFDLSWAWSRSKSVFHQFFMLLKLCGAYYRFINKLLLHAKLFLRLSSQIIRNMPKKMIRAARKPKME